MSIATPPVNISLTLTTSLHPHLIIQTQTPLSRTHLPCNLHLALVIPDALFPDPAELTDIWGQQDTPLTLSISGSSSACVSWSLVPSIVDIERPLMLDSPGVALSIIIADALVSKTDTSLLDIPLHARYLPPSESDGWDVAVFGEDGGSFQAAWTCGPEWPPEPNLLPAGHNLHIHLPAARPSLQVPVELATALVVWLGWAWIMYKMISVTRRSWSYQAVTDSLSSTSGSTIENWKVAYEQ